MYFFNVLQVRPKFVWKERETIRNHSVTYLNQRPSPQPSPHPGRQHTLQAFVL